MRGKRLNEMLSLCTNIENGLHNHCISIGVVIVAKKEKKHFGIQQSKHMKVDDDDELEPYCIHRTLLRFIMLHVYIL